MSPRALPRVLVYCQHLSGAGHFVRSHEIARALAAAGHEVRLVHGGWPVPRRSIDGAFAAVHLPGLVRRGGRVVALDDGGPAEPVLAARRAVLLDAAAAFSPHVLLVEHFPFSKWELETEILALIAAVRGAVRPALVLSSLRDAAPFGARERDAGDHAEKAGRLLREHFDAVLVHADPDVLRVEDESPWLTGTAVPVHYTGYVSEEPGCAAGTARAGWVVSSGGLRAPGLAEAAVAAWRARPTRRGPLRVFGARADHEPDLGGDVARAPFSSGFLDALAAAELSIGQAGYNTCTNLLETRTRAVLVPAPAMQDQRLRAARLAELGLAVTIDAADLDALPAAIDEALARPPPEHAIDLDGAAATARLIGALAR